MEEISSQTTDNLHFIVPPHIEQRTGQHAEDVSGEIRARRRGAIRMKRSRLNKTPNNNANIDNQDIFTAKGTFNLPGWKLADDAQEADTSYNRSVNVCWDSSAEILDFYKTVIGIDLSKHLDGQLVSSVDVGDKYNNAFFNGYQMAYGEGDGIHFKDFCFDETVVCHELGHGIVDSTVPLIYQGDSGALNESYADIFAICFHHYKINKKFKDLSKNDWMIGDKCVVGEGALRSFTKTPSRPANHPLGRDSEPRHLRKKYKGKQDNGGVHINSSIINHAFYRLCKHTNANSWENPLQLWVSLLKNKKIRPNCNFKQFAKTLVVEAKRLHGDDFSKKVKMAMKDVGFFRFQRV